MSQIVKRPKRELNICANDTDASLVFDTSDPILSFSPGIDFGLLMVQAGAFTSVKAAWKRKYKGSVPVGWTSFVVDDLEINLWNPTGWEGQGQYPDPYSCMI